MFAGREWKLMDPTFASSGGQSKDIMEYIGNTANCRRSTCRRASVSGKAAVREIFTTR